MDRKDMDFARIWARRYISEHHPHGLDEEDVENMILRRLHYNKDKGERGRKTALSLALNEAMNAGRRNFRASSEADLPRQFHFCIHFDPLDILRGA